MKTDTRMQPKTQGTVDVTRRNVILRGLTPMMFDRYAGDNQTQLEPHQKMYYLEDMKTLCLPACNISSFLSSENTTSAPRRLLGKKYRQTAQACLSYVSIEPFLIPIRRNGDPIVFGAFEGEKDPKSGTFIHRSVARLKGGLPNPKVRPVLPTPWELSFSITIYPNNEIKDEMLLKLFKDGGIALGLGTFRGVFGKFEVAAWE